jgi:2,7-dihydroxy-5-methyl-1-naphthoate 7-O-methyltransferase
LARNAEPSLATLSDLATPWCVHVVATLRIADRIAEGTHRVADLADAAGVDPDALRRVLRHLAQRGLFRETRGDRFALNPTARELIGNGSRWLDLDGIGGRMAYAWGTLPKAVRSGRPAYSDVFGRPFWDDLAAHPALRREFDALLGPEGHGAPDPDVLVHDDWTGVRSVVDVGGGTGSLLAAVLRAHPGVTGTLVDLPATAGRARATFREQGVGDRARAVGQSFFEPLPSGADLYLLKSVLADWADPEARALLRECAVAARPRGRVVLVNGVAPDEEGESPELLMLVLVGGRSRTLRQFRTLARSAGLWVTAAGRTRSGRFVVECRPLSRRTERR